MHDPDYDAFCRQRLENPHPFYARLREQEPVHWCESMHMWFVSRYDDISAVIRDRRRLISSRQSMYTDPLLSENRELASPLVDHIGLWLQNLNPPQHTRVRELINLAFTPRMVEDTAPRIEAIVNRLLDETIDAGETDFVRSFCLPLSALVICEMLGIPQQEQARYRASVEGLMSFSSGAGTALNAAIPRARASLDDVTALFDELIAQRRAHPAGDLLSSLVTAEADGDRLGRDELLALCVFLFVAGHDTTMGLLAGGTAALLRHPEQWAMFKSDPEGLAESAVEEFVRYESPVTRAVRVPTEDIEIRGTTIPRGQTLTLLLVAANRDPEAFANPNRIDIQRHPNKHLGFGYGIHFCLGAALARLEGKIAFRAIAQRLPNLELATDHVPYSPALGKRSISSLPIRTGPSTRRAHRLIREQR